MMLSRSRGYPGTGFSATSRQPSNAGVFWRQAFTKPANGIGKQNEHQVNPALRLLAHRWR